MKISKHVMIFPAVYFFTWLFISPSFGDFCKEAYDFEDLHDAYNCSKSSLTNLTKPDSDEGELVFCDGTGTDHNIFVEKVSSLHCCFYAQPYCPIITWYKEGVKVKEDDPRRKIRQGGRQLEIYGSLEDNGNYTCTATTPYRDEFASHTIIVKATRVCNGNFTVVTAPPAKDVIKLKRGSNQRLVWNFICFGRINSESVVCRNGNRELLSKYPEYYNVSSYPRRPTGENQVALQKTVRVLNFSRSDNITCRTTRSGSPSATFILQLEEEEAASGKQQTPEENFFKEKGVWILIGCSVLVCLVGIFGLWYIKKVKRKTLIFYRPNKNEVAVRYDAFISYSEADGGLFVRSTLRPMLEEECGYTLSLHYREFVPGTTVVDNIIDAIYDSRRIVTVITPKFLESEWCKFEVDQGLRSAIEKPNTMVVIMLNEIPPNQLPKSLRTFLSDVTFLLWDDGKREEMRKKLKGALGQPFTVNNSGESEKDGSRCEICPKDMNADTCNHRNNSNNCDSSKDFGSDNVLVDIV